MEQQENYQKTNKDDRQQERVETNKTGQRQGGLDKNGLKEVDYYESDRNPKA